MSLQYFTYIFTYKILSYKHISNIPSECPGKVHLPLKVWPGLASAGADAGENAGQAPRTGSMSVHITVIPAP